MAKFHPDNVKRAALKGVSRQLGGWLDETTVEKFRAAGPGTSPPSEFIDELPLTDGQPSAQPQEPVFELKETFAVWMLSLDSIEEGLRTEADLFCLVKPTKRWHHQIACDGQPAGFARSVSEDAAGMDVSQLYFSDLAISIDEAIDHLDEFEKKNPDYAAANPLVRLLFIPSYQTYAFWLIKNPPEGLSWLVSSALGKIGVKLERPQVTSDVFIIDAPPDLTPLRPLTMLTSQQLLAAFREMQPLGGGLTFTPLPPGR